MFKIISKTGSARAGVLETAHGKLNTPFFMSIASKGAVKGLDSSDLKNIKAPIVLANTYHLWLRPGDKLIGKVKSKNLSKLHAFMNWDGPILSDSGGFQVFSLAKLRKISEKGVEFRSHIDGEKKMLAPEDSIKIQRNLGVDIMMVLDECIGYPASHKKAEDALERTTRWAKRCLTEHAKIKKNKPLIFGIVQGSSFEDLRIRSAKEISSLDFDGLAIGGVAVGESPDEMKNQVDYCVDYLPQDKPRYLMGVGFPEQILDAVSRGVDMFDCVIPTRIARHGTLFKLKVSEARLKKIVTNKLKNKNKKIKASDFYELIRISNNKFEKNQKHLDLNCDCNMCKNYSLMYLRHLYMTKESLYTRLATMHNLNFYIKFMKIIRECIIN